MARKSNNGTTYVKLEKRLVLLAWLNDMLGYDSNKELLSDIKEAEEGWDPYGRSYVYHRIVGREGVKIALPVLGKYDDNIKAHLEAINARRAEPITLRYFQYLAILYAEIFLDWYINSRAKMLSELNKFVAVRNSNKPPGDVKDSRFSESDLSKLAFWMATGSGKTLIMHFNYRQFLYYNKGQLDNILLITPNEGLTEQHIEEMKASGLPCERFNLEESGLRLGAKNTVRVIEITKLVEQKRGGGITVPVEAFEGNNLIFVDEGHKGSGGQAWRGFRDRLGETGFTFEYSATFGQALNATKKDKLTEEYGKCIVFDYSYKYFHGDGYGKDFHILNLKEEASEEKTETLLLGNLLSFYEQLKCFGEQKDKLRPYNLGKPLWVFVGSTVNAVYTENKQKRSDVLTVARFLHHCLENKNGWIVKAIKKIIDGKTGLIDAHGEDVFASRFDYLRNGSPQAESIYGEILEKVFGAPAGGALHMCDIKGSSGELGLKVSSAEDYFGLIYIGDTSAFKKLVEIDDSGIVLEEDVIGGSLFEGINNPDTPIDILIGAKKFMEGWNSWRVSNMGLLNIGRSEGSEIIQLFGRGVRLMGLDRSLKRSSAIDGQHPEHIRLLENLNIFAVRANYMAQFREYLEREGVETEGHIELPLAIKANMSFLKKGLVVPRIPENRSFADECDIVLQLDKAAKVSIDMSLKVESMRSDGAAVATVAMKAGQEQTITNESLDLLDWQQLYLELVEYKERKGFCNLVIRPEALRRVVEQSEPKLYRLVAEHNVVKPNSFREVDLLREAVVSILRKYVDKFYRVQQERWDSRHMAYRELDSDDPNFRNYTIKIPRSEAKLIKAIKELIDEGNRIYEQETRELPNIHFDRHLYQPLLIERGDKIKSEPKGLEPSEETFVKNVREHVRKEAGKSLADKEIFLLRNLSRGKGIGFFENEGFYPDFILWVKNGKQQRIIFIEPHGMRQEKTYWTSDKAQLHERLAKLSKEWGQKTGLKNVELDSFIISATTYDELREYYGDGNWTKKQFADKHVLFFERNKNYDYLGMLFSPLKQDVESKSGKRK
ncbi:MAG TPA: DEAD/DEAH box helicase family protein [Sedimentisphaerales bacterium]|nr:DEAD/DEAH box helicase family protein [Sedimentisphaerales bacterium]